MELDWHWPENPETVRDLIAAHYRNWGRGLAYQNADQIIALLNSKGWLFERLPQSEDDLRHL